MYTFLIKSMIHKFESDHFVSLKYVQAYIFFFSAPQNKLREFAGIFHSAQGSFCPGRLAASFTVVSPTARITLGDKYLSNKQMRKVTKLIGKDPDAGKD